MATLEEQLLAGFEAGTVIAETFRHEDHIRVAWILLRTTSVPRAIERFERGVRALAESAGRPDRFHRTITWAYVLLVSDRMAQEPRDATFEAFARRNPDLLDWHGVGLRPWYRDEVLASDAARERFLFPEPHRPSATKKPRGNAQESR